jgi:hypothetical protein
VVRVAAHAVRTAWLGTSGASARRAADRDDRGETASRTAQPLDLDGPGDPDFTDVDVLAIDAEVRARLTGGPQDRRSRGPLRHRSSADAVSDLMVTSTGAATRAPHTRAHGVLPQRRRYPRRERLTASPVTLRSDPAYPAAVPDHVLAASSSPFASVFDNGLDAPASTWVDAGVLSALPPRAHRGMTGLPLHPAVGNLVLEATARDGRRPGRGPRPRPAGDLAVLHPGGHPMTLLLTGLTRTASTGLRRRGGRRGDELPVQRQPVDLMRRLRAAAPRSRRSVGSGASTSASPRCPRCPWRASTFPRRPSLLKRRTPKRRNRGAGPQAARLAAGEVYRITACRSALRRPANR